SAAGRTGSRGTGRFASRRAPPCGPAERIVLGLKSWPRRDSVEAADRRRRSGPLAARLHARILERSARGRSPREARRRPSQGRLGRLQIHPLAGVQDALGRRGQGLDRWLDAPQLENARRLLENARTALAEPKAADLRKLAALQVLGRDTNTAAADRKAILPLLTAQYSADCQIAAIAPLTGLPDD